MWYAATAKSNEQVKDITEANRALIAGGTQGIGAGIALRFALAGASVWIIGRSAQRGGEVVQKLHLASEESQRRRQKVTGKPDHHFFQADLSDVHQVQQVAKHIQERSKRGGIDWLFECQGGPPTGNSSDTGTGIDKHFAVQCLSRYHLTKLLLSGNSINKGVCFIGAPGKGSAKELDLNDIECRIKRSRWGFNILASGQRDSTVLDTVAQAFSEKHPNIMFAHLFPGIVGTDAAGNQGFPFPLPQVSKLVSVVVPSASQYAEIPFYMMANPDGLRYLRSGEGNFFGPMFRRMPISKNADNRETRAKILSKLDSYIM